MKKEDFYELIAQIDIDAKEFIKDKDEFKRIMENAYSIGAMEMLRKIISKDTL